MEYLFRRNLRQDVPRTSGKTWHLAWVNPNVWNSGCSGACRLVSPRASCPGLPKPHSDCGRLGPEVESPLSQGSAERLLLWLWVRRPVSTAKHSRPASIVIWRSFSQARPHSDGENGRRPAERYSRNRAILPAETRLIETGLPGGLKPGVGALLRKVIKVVRADIAYAVTPPGEVVRTRTVNVLRWPAAVI
jgi:hypothetical protein